MELIVLGSGTGWPRRERNASGYLVRTPNLTLLLDIGPGTLRRLSEVSQDINRLDCIFVSHWHPDHVSDLVPLLFATRYQLGYFRKEPLLLISAQGFRRFYESLKSAYGHWIEPPEGLLKIYEVSPKRLTELELNQEVKVITGPVRHNPESVAVRIEAEGKSLVYTGDTEECEEVVEIAKGADLMICECAFPDEMRVSGHCSPSCAANMAEKAGVKVLLLSHLYPPCEEVNIAEVAQKYFSGKVIVAEDLMKISV